MRSESNVDLLPRKHPLGARGGRSDIYILLYCISWSQRMGRLQLVFTYNFGWVNLQGRLNSALLGRHRFQGH